MTSSLRFTQPWLFNWGIPHMVSRSLVHAGLHVKCLLLCLMLIKMGSVISSKLLQAETETHEVNRHIFGTSLQMCLETSVRIPEPRTFKIWAKARTTSMQWLVVWTEINIRTTHVWRTAEPIILLFNHGSHYLCTSTKVTSKSSPKQRTHLDPTKDRCSVKEQSFWMMFK